MIIKLKRYFNFGLCGKARLHLRKTHSNIFVTLTDLHNNVVICKSSGSLVLLVLSVVKKLL